MIQACSLELVHLLDGGSSIHESSLAALHVNFLVLLDESRTILAK
jgi:hypothetical protein